MKVEDAVQHMTKSYLHRVIDSFTRDFPKLEEDRSRDIILRNIDELTEPRRVANVLTLRGAYADQTLLRGILEVLIEAEDHRLDEGTLVERVSEAQKSIIKVAQSDDALKYEDAKSVEIFKAVLEVALEDENVSDQELRLVRRLREKLGLSEKAKELILAQMNHYPRAGNRIHTPSEFRDALIDLQRRGVLLYCNKLDSGQFVVPEEIVPAIRRALEIELSATAWDHLLSRLSQNQLGAILSAAGLPKSGTKEEQKERIQKAALRPSKALDSLSNQDLYEVCKALPGAKVSGTKQDRIDRLIDYFATLVTKEVPAEVSPGERFYRYLVELAHRDRESLLTNQVIKKDIDMERAFEEGTRFLVAEKLGLDLVSMPGSDHPDGCFRLKRSKDLLMWDNKSKEAVYDFPESHVRQFKRYIRDSRERVSCFLVIVPEVGDGAEMIAQKLKVDSGADTDVALITAENLVWVAEKWPSYSKNGSFDPEVFNHTGVLTRKALDQRMKLFLS